MLAYCELKDKERVVNVVSDYEIDYIFHLGAQPIVTVAYNYPYETLMSNIAGTINVLEAGRLCNYVKGILVFTSDKAYGKHDKVPYDETYSLHGDHPYDCSKSCADLISQMFTKTYNMPIVIARCGNLFGQGDLNFNRIVPGAIQALLKDEILPIRSDGTPVREYVYVKEAAAACIELIQKLEKTKGQAFNIGSGMAHSVLQVIEELEKALGMKIEREILNIAKNEIPKQFLSSDKIRRAIGWQNKSDFITALKETYDWYRKNQELLGWQ